MSDPGIFIAGSVIFIITAWAAFAFGLARFAELAQRDADPGIELDVVTSEPDRP